MSDSILFTAVTQLATATHTFTDADLDQPYFWRKHDEGVRFALLGSLQELRELAVQLVQERAEEGVPITAVQRVLAQNHTGFRDLQALLFAVTDETYGQEPAPGEWPLRTIIGHIVGSERWFYSLVHSGLRYKRAGELPPSLPNDAPETLIGPYADFRQLMESGTLNEMMSYFRNMHFRSWQEFGDLTDEELAAPSPLWWEEETYSIQYRLHRFDAHLRQHLIQAEKTVDQLGLLQTEAKRLLRLLYNALAEVEALTIGAPDVGLANQQALAETIRQRATAITAVTQQARELETAVKNGDIATVQAILQQSPRLASAIDQNKLSLILTAAYHNEPAIADLLLAAGAEVSIFSAAAIGHLEKLQAHVQEWPGWVHEYNRDGYTALQLACFFGCQKCALWLIEQGADVNAVAKNAMKITPIHAAAANANLTVLRALLEKGANVNAQQQGGFTALHEATRTNNIPMLRLCLEFGANPEIMNDDGKAALELAENASNGEATQLLEASLA